MVQHVKNDLEVRGQPQARELICRYCFMCIDNRQQLQAGVMGLRKFSQKSLVSSYGCEGCENDNGTPQTKHAQE